MNYCYMKNPLNFGIDLAQRGGTTAILDLCYDVLYTKQVDLDRNQQQGNERSEQLCERQ